MRGILGILHFVAEFQESVLDVVEAIWWWLPVPRRSYRRHDNDLTEQNISRFL